MSSLYPSEIHYCQDSISNTFRDGNFLGETLDELCDGRLNICDIPTISVYDDDGRWITADNRRLWVFKMLERLGKCGQIPVIEINNIPSDKLTSTNGGVSVRVRGHPGGSWYRNLEDSDISSDESEDEHDESDSESEESEDELYNNFSNWRI